MLLVSCRLAHKRQAKNEGSSHLSVRKSRNMCYNLYLLLPTNAIFRLLWQQCVKKYALIGIHYHVVS